MIWAKVGICQSSRTQALTTYNGSGVAKTHDTLVNTDTCYLWCSRNDFSSWQDIAIQYTTVKAGGSSSLIAFVQGSYDATAVNNGNWTTLKNCTTCATVGTVDTGTKVGTTYMFNMANSYFPKLRVVIYQTGVGKSVPSGTYWVYEHYFKSN